MQFRHRAHAAQLLAERLAVYQGKNPLVLAIPRGAVPMGKIIAEALGGELDVVLVHKLGAPGNSELAIGAVDETGSVYIGKQARLLEVDDDYIEQEKRVQWRMLRQRRAPYTPVHAPLNLAGRIVIVVDNGIATGASMLAALRLVRPKHPAKLIAAVAVAPADTLARIQHEADEVVCAYVAEFFYGVGQFFEDFSQVSDAEVITILQQSCATMGAQMS